MSLKIDTSKYKTLEEKLIFLIDLINEFKLTEVLILVNLKTFLSKNQIEEIYKHSLYREVNILLIENTEFSEKLEYEKKLVIDNDFDDFSI